MKERIKVLHIGEPTNGSYPIDHTPDHCDRCLALVGQEHLRRVPFIYCDYNDQTHQDLGKKYRQYYVCDECWTPSMEQMEQSYKKRSIDDVIW